MAGSRFSSTEILVVVLGYRQERMAGQMRTFAKHFPTVFMSETELGHCVFCGTDDGGTPFNAAINEGWFKQPFFAAGKGRFDHRPLGWYCGKKLQVGVRSGD